MPSDDLAALAARAAPPAPAGLVLARRRGGGAVERVVAGPVDADAVFELGSIAKAVTGLLLADAVVRGEVALETPLAACLPGARAVPPIALAQLAAHTSGLPRLPLAFLRRVGMTNMTDPYAGATVDALVADLARVRVRRRRRGRARYSNFGAALLGQALAARAGMPYERLVERRVLGPLGVTEVWARDAPAVAQPHDRRGRPVPAWAFGAYAPAGGLWGTARGALALATACAAPPPAMAEAVALALAPRTRGRPVVGLGWLRGTVGRGRTIWWHNGGTHGSRAFVAFDPDRGDAVAAVANAARSVDRVARAALQA